MNGNVVLDESNFATYCTPESIGATGSQTFTHKGNSNSFTIQSGKSYLVTGIALNQDLTPYTACLWYIDTNHGATNSVKLFENGTSSSSLSISGNTATLAMNGPGGNGFTCNVLTF